MFLTSWSYESGLSVATAWPTIRCIAERDDVESVVLVTLDRQPAAREVVARDLSPKVQHIAIPEIGALPKLIRLALRHARYHAAVRRAAKTRRANLVVCRGSAAIPYGLALVRSLQLPLVVESFEPHSAYMRDSGQWPAHSWRYRIQRRWEEAAVKHAKRLITVSRRFAQQLVGGGGVGEAKVRTLPCSADPQLFHPDDDAGDKVRNALGLEGLQCVYAGKFGGLYLDPAEAARLIRSMQEAFGEPGFSMLILTTDDPAPARQAFAQAGVGGKLTILSAAPAEVPAYLRAADFAVSFVRRTASSYAQSPIKHAEYWASGLPFLCSRGISDEEELISQDPRIGATVDMHSLASIQEASSRLRTAISSPGYKRYVHDRWLARRGENDLANVYTEIFEELRLEGAASDSETRDVQRAASKDVR